MPSNHHPLSSPSPPAFNPSIRVFSNESVLHIRWPKYSSLSFSISPSNAGTQEVPRHTRLHSRGSTRVPPTYRGAPFLPPSSRGGILSLRVLERIPGVPVAFQAETQSKGKARGTPGSCHHSQIPPDVSVHSRENCFPCTASTFKPRIDSHHGGTWDSPVGKPRRKASWESLEGMPQIP